MKNNRFITAAILTISLFLMTGRAGADLLWVGEMHALSFSPFSYAGIILDEDQNLAWADFTTLNPDGWYHASDWAGGIDAVYFWVQDPLDFSNGWRLPTADEFHHLWSQGLKNIPGSASFNRWPFQSLYELDYWTATQPNPWSAFLFSTASGESNLFDTTFPGYAMAVRDVVPDNQVPVPSGLVLLALGVLGLAGIIRRRKIPGRG